MTEEFNFENELGLSREWLNSLYPFFILLDEYLTILEYGDLLGKAVKDISKNQGLDNFFEYFENDELKEITYESILKNSESTIKMIGKLAPLKLWGKVKVIEEKKYVLLIVTPYIKAINEITRYKIKEEDLPLSDATLDYLDILNAATGGGAGGSTSKYAKDDEKKEQGFVVPGLDGSDIEVPEDYNVLKDMYKKMAYEFGKVARASTELQDIIRDKTQELDMQVVMTQEALKKAEAEREKAEKAREEALSAKDEAENAKEEAISAKDEAENAREEALRSREEAIKAKDEADKSREEAEHAREEALRSREEALLAKDEADKSREEAERAKKEVEKAKEELELAYAKVDKARAEARAEADEAIADIVVIKNKAEEDFEILKGKVGTILDIVKLASEGDLRQRVPVSGDDPIGQVGDGLNEFFTNLKNNVMEIESCANALKKASLNLSDNNKLMKKNSAETNKQTFQATEASTKVTDGMNEVEGSMKNMIDAIKEITQITTEASKLSNDTSELAKSTNDTITELDLSSTKIGEVIKLIEGIAHQTNLLSLNAQIEAMWAGDAGKGFRVVANEVKELSKQTAMATQQVEKMITNIQSDSKKAISAVSQISESIMTMTTYTKRISESMVQQSSYTGIVGDVVLATSESIKEINESIVLVKESANNTDSAIGTSQSSAENVGNWSENLSSLVARFKI